MLASIILISSLMSNETRMNNKYPGVYIQQEIDICQLFSFQDRYACYQGRNKTMCIVCIFVTFYCHITIIQRNITRNLDFDTIV